ncbi:MAG TPA: CaiB/BaiF CoA-transferase family protein [Gemmatimonadaceae bacterium]
METKPSTAASAPSQPIRHPLDGIVVLSLEHAVAAPFCSRQLADYGARVIKVERPGAGDFARHYDSAVKGLSSYFVWLNRSKESLSLDIKHPAAHAIFDALLPRVDVLVQNLAPGSATRLGLDYASLSSRFPRLIVVDISGYGDSGPFRDKKAYDLLVQAESGLVSVTGSADTPSRAGVSIADIAAGMYAYSGTLMALFQRERTGRGTRVEVSMLEALSEWMSQPRYFAEGTGHAPARSGASHPSIAPYGPHRAGDGRDVLFGIQNEREWTRFCGEVLNDAALATESRFSTNVTRVANRAELTRTIESNFASRTSAEIIRDLDRAGIANGRVNDARAVRAHEQLEARGRWRSVATPADDIDATLPPVNLDGAEPVMGAVPDLGAHTDAILGELGFTADRISELRQTGAI